MKNKVTALAASIALFSVWACNQEHLTTPTLKSYESTVRNGSGNLSFTAVGISKEQFKKEFSAMQNSFPR
jgi:hypothetical protein